MKTDDDEGSGANVKKVKLLLVDGCGACHDSKTGLTWELHGEAHSVSVDDADRLLSDPTATFEEIA